MNSNDGKYSKFGLVHDMLQTADIIGSFDASQVQGVARQIASAGKLLFTGEGSSRIFPSKHAIQLARRNNWPIALHSEAGRQAQEYNLDGWAVLAASNSGKTSEVIKLYQNLKARNHPHLYALVANENTLLQELSATGFVLSCGKERAVAATKSVVEQALFDHALVEHIAGKPALAGQLKPLSAQFRDVLCTPIDAGIVEKLSRAGTIYFAGRNDGVAEELTLKTNEITRRKSDYLEGTYAVHGIEEVMNRDDVVIWIDPYPDSEQKFADVLVKGVGLTVIAIADRQTQFPTIRIPKSDLPAYLYMAAGWNLLVEIGIALGINLDKPIRARKVGNEFVG